MNRLPLIIVVGIASALVLRIFVVDIIQVTSASMQPTVNIGCRYLLEKLTYRFSKPKRNDVIAFPSPVLKNHSLVKRVIAVEGETLEIKNKDVYINDQKLFEDFAFHSRDKQYVIGRRARTMARIAGVNSDGPGEEIMPPMDFGTVEVGKLDRYRR